MRLAVLEMLIGEMKRGIDKGGDGADDHDQQEKAQVFLQHDRPSQWTLAPTASCMIVSSLSGRGREYR